MWCPSIQATDLQTVSIKPQSVKKAPKNVDPFSPEHSNLLNSARSPNFLEDWRHTSQKEPSRHGFYIRQAVRGSGQIRIMDYTEVSGLMLGELGHWDYHLGYGGSKRSEACCAEAVLQSSLWLSACVEPGCWIL